jgi:subtilisin family serine protease
VRIGLALVGALFAALAAPGLARANAAGAHVVVRFEEAVPRFQQDAALAGAGLVRVDEIAPLDVVVARAAGAHAAASAAARLDALPAVDYAGRDGEARALLLPNDPEYGVWRWPAARTQLERAWDVTLGGDAATIAIVDTGVSAVPDLTGRLLPGRDFVNGDDDASDDHGHGTLVAGVAAAATNNATGVAGVCSGCRILPVKVLDAQATGTFATIAAGIVWAADHGADVINASLGGQHGAQVLEDAVRYATDRGALVVLAAGNAGSEDPNACHPTSGQCGGYPAYYATTNPGILSVGASDENDALYAFSNRGSWVRVAAPGCVRTTTHGGGYATACGTSIAAPLVAGIAGLLESWKPELTNLELKGAIESGATAVGGLGVATGRVDAYAALLAAGWAPPPPLVETSPAPESERAEPGRMAGPVLAGRATVGGVLRAAVRGASPGAGRTSRARAGRCSSCGRSSPAGRSGSSPSSAAAPASCGSSRARRRSSGRLPGRGRAARTDWPGRCA